MDNECVPFFVGVGLDKEIEQVVIVALSQDRADCVRKCKSRFRGKPIFVFGFDEDINDVADNIKNWLWKNEVPNSEHSHIIQMIAEEIENRVMAGGSID